MLGSSPPGASDALGGYAASTLLSAPKHAPLALQLRSRGRNLALDKNPGESVEHLVLKALVWALLLPTHADAEVERDLGMRYRPDVVALDDASGMPLWWGECGSVKPRKLRELATSFPETKFSVAKWGRSDLRGYAANLRTELALPAERRAPFELLNFPSTAIDDFLSDDGEITVSYDDVQVVNLLLEEEQQRAGRPRGRSRTKRRGG